MADSKDNVKVAIRVRPLSKQEISEGGKKCVTVHSEHNCISLDAKPEPKLFQYDYVADASTSQAEFFEKVGKPIAESCLSGYNGTIFAYGQTGAGKTFTITGLSLEDLSVEFQTPHELRGLLPRCFEYLFSAISESTEKTDQSFLVKCSFLEIYQEQVIDLLEPSSQQLQVREDMQRGVYVDGLNEQTVSNVMQTYEILRTGARNRHVGFTSMNKESSRSHAVFTLVIESKEVVEGLINFKSAKFHLIDLAGSERQKATATKGERLKEAGMINKSLSALGNVINSLVDIGDGRNRYVHYRDSKLTFLLKASLGGNSKTYIVANISPSESAHSETLSTLKFAERAKKIENKAVINEDTTGTISLLKEEIKRLKKELAELKAAECHNCKVVKETPVLSDRSSRYEMLLEHNVRLRQDAERDYFKKLKDKDNYIQALNNTLQKLEKKLNHDKMVIKFRDATIASLQGKTEGDQELENLKHENQILREQLESPPIAAKLYLENEQLKFELENLKKEVSQEPESLVARLENMQEFTQKLCEVLEESASEREKVKKILENQGSQELDQQISELKLALAEEKKAREEAEAKLKHQEKSNYEQEIQEARNQMESYANNQKMIEQENEMLRRDLDSLRKANESEDNLLASVSEELFSRSKSYISDHDKEELDTLKESLSKELNEIQNKCQEKDTQIENLLVELSQLHEKLELAENDSKEKTEKLEQFKFTEEQLKYEQEKLQTTTCELKNAQIKIEDLNEALDYAESQVKELQKEKSEHESKFRESETEIGNLNLQIQEQQKLITSLQDPTGNQPLAIALSENESYKQQISSLYKQLQETKISSSEISAKFNDLATQYQELKTDYDTASKASTDLQKRLIEVKKELSETYEGAENLKEKVKFYKDQNKKTNQKLNELQTFYQETTENQSLKQTLEENQADYIYDLQQQIEELKNNLEHYKELSISLSQKNAEATSELAKVRDDYSYEEELSEAREHIRYLTEENFSRLQILKNTNKNILSSRQEINMWKRCIDEKNTLIKEMRMELRDKSEEIENLKSMLKTLRKAKESEKESYLCELIEMKDKELQKLKDQKSDDSQKKEINMLSKRCSHLQSELKRTKEQLKKTQSDLKPEHFEESTLLNQLKLKKEKIHYLKKRLSESSKRSSQVEFLNKELRRKTEEVQNLSGSLNRISEYVLSIPIVKINPEETNIVESTIQGVKKIYEALVSKTRHKKQFPSRQLQTSPSKMWSPVEHYHALLDASELKNRDLVSPQSRRFDYK